MLNTASYIFVVFLCFTTHTRSKCQTRNLRICFHDNTYNQRGTATALYEYAHYNEVLLNNTSIILVPDTDIHGINGIALPKFKARFGEENVIYYAPQKERSGTLSLALLSLSQRCSVLYIVKSGELNSYPKYSDSFCCEAPPIAVHAIFSWEIHGATYAMVSKEQMMNLNRSSAVTMTSELDKWVPHIIDPPNERLVEAGKVLDWRGKHNISLNTFVICRHGSADTFSIKFTQEAVCIIANQYRDTKAVSFVFLGTNRWGSCSTDQTLGNTLIFIPATAKALEKEAFFSMCDVMLHARAGGEQFSIAIGEMSVRNKPVLHNPDGGIPQPIETHENAKNYIYTNQSTLLQLIERLIEYGVPAGDFNAYGEYSAANVMNRFDRVLIQPAITKRCNYSRSEVECEPCAGRIRQHHYEQEIKSQLQKKKQTMRKQHNERFKKTAARLESNV